MFTCLTLRDPRPAVTLAAGLALAACLLQSAPWPVVAESPLDQLDPRAIPAALRPDDPPRELVGVLRGASGPPTGQVCSAAVSPDGRWVAAGTRGGTVRLFAVPGLECRWERAAHGEKVTALAFAPDGQSLWSGGFDGSLLRWSLDGTRQPWPGADSAHAGPVFAIAHSPDGRTVATGSRGCVRLWALERQRLALTAELSVPDCPMQALAFSPSGRRLAGGGGGDRAIRLWRLDGERPELDAILPGHDDSWVRALAFSRDGAALTSLDAFGSGIVWDGRGPHGSWRVFCPPCIIAAFAADGRHLLTVHGDGSAWLLRVPGGWTGP